MINQFLMNLMLTFVWVALTGHLNYINFLFGYAMSFFILWLIQRKKNTDYFYRVPKVLSFILYFFYEMLKSNLVIARDVLSPKFQATPGIIKYPMKAKSDFEITMLSNLLSLTPGTLIIDVSDDKTVMYIHVMYLTDKSAFIDNLRNGLERKLLEIIR